MKKQWTKPKLITLFRARSDESVLGYCKTIGNPVGPQTFYEACNYDRDVAGCQPIFCDTSTTS